MKIKWKCKACQETITSDTSKHHEMNWCKCRKSRVDGEEVYVRVAGNTKILSEK